MLVCIIADEKRNKEFILMEKRLCSLYKTESEYTVSKRFVGSKLFGLSYPCLYKKDEKV